MTDPGLAAGLAVGAYVLGSLPFGYWVAKSQGVDILSVGSGNPGATNVWRSCGKKAGLIVWALDITKGLVPAAVALALFNNIFHAFLVGACAVIGHTFSPFLKFKGGKGIATAAGMMLGSAPIAGAIALSVFFMMLWRFRYVSLASIIAAASLPPVSYFLGYPIEVTFAYSVLAAYLIYKHKDNIARLREGTERRFEFGSKKEPISSTSDEEESSSGR